MNDSIYSLNRKQSRRHSNVASLGVALLIYTLLLPTILSADPTKAFPDAQGWAAYTPGGRGGKILRVTNLKASGPGSFAAAVQAKGPRIIVFEVGGVIDLQKTSIAITEPFLTIAGQTAPSPGITFIRGGIHVGARDVVIRHIRVRPGEAGARKKSGWEVDGIATGSFNIIVDHCSCTWATDENLSASGPRFDGKSVAEWRKNTSHRVTFSNCIIAEGLSHSTHAKGEHSKGSLIHDNATDIAIIGNLYASNVQRNPYFKGGVRGIVVNNYIVNPGRKAMHYGLPAGEWFGHKYVTGQMAIVANVLQYGPNTPAKMPLFALSGSGPVQVFAKDNLALDESGKDVRIIGTTSKKCQQVNTAPRWPKAIELRPVTEVKAHVLKNVGARPWDRDAIDARIVREARNGRGRIIDSEQEVGGYPVHAQTRARFVVENWDLATMERR
jgi:pectate lyase